MDPSNRTPTPIDPRLVKFVMHQLLYGPEKNVHVVARRKFLDGLLTVEQLSKTVDQIEKRKLELFDDAVSFMVELGITITQTAKALKDQGLNEEDPTHSKLYPFGFSEDRRFVNPDLDARLHHPPLVGSSKATASSLELASCGFQRAVRRVSEDVDAITVKKGHL